MKRFLTISILLQAITAFMTLALVAVFAVYALYALQAQQQAHRVSVLDISNDLFTATLNARLERGDVNAALVTPEPIDGDAQKQLVDLRIRSETAIDSALAKIPAIGLDDLESPMEGLRGNWNAWVEMRYEVDRALQQPIDGRRVDLHQQWVEANAKLMRAIDLVARQLEAELSAGDSFLAEMIKIKQIAWTVRADSGDDRLLVRDAMLKGQKLSLDQQRQFAVLTDRMDAMWQLVQADAHLARTPPELEEAVETAGFYFIQFRPVRNTGDDPANDYLKHIGINVVVRDIFDKHPAFQYVQPNPNRTGVAYELIKDNEGRIFSLVITKTW